jgi:hypothetical protein
MNELPRDIPPTTDLSPSELNPDPQLSLSSGRASVLQIALTALGSIFIVALMIYGLNRPMNERGQIASAPPAPETTGAAQQEQRAQPPNNEPAQAEQPVNPAQPDDSKR